MPLSSDDGGVDPLSDPSVGAGLLEGLSALELGSEAVDDSEETSD